MIPPDSSSPWMHDTLQTEQWLQLLVLWTKDKRFQKHVGKTVEEYSV